VSCAQELANDRVSAFIQKRLFSNFLKHVIVSSTGPMNALPKAIERLDKALLASLKESNDSRTFFHRSSDD
jgi:hypothetical protein